MIFLGDFYSLWKKTLFELKKIGDENNFGKIVYEKINARTDKLFENNDILLSALYVDPRFNYAGKPFFTPELKCRAEVNYSIYSPNSIIFYFFFFGFKAYLLKLCKQIRRFHNAEPVNPPQSAFDAEVTEFDLFLEADHSEGLDCVPENSDKMLWDMIVKCCNQSRILASNENFNVFHYFRSKYFNNKIMLEACLTVMAAPNNQSSVERSFSACRILLSHLRFNLSPESINDVLMCHLNRDIFSKINFDLMI